MGWPWTASGFARPGPSIIIWGLASQASKICLGLHNINLGGILSPSERVWRGVRHVPITQIGHNNQILKIPENQKTQILERRSGNEFQTRCIITVYTGRRCQIPSYLKTHISVVIARRQLHHHSSVRKLDGDWLRRGRKAGYKVQLDILTVYSNCRVVYLIRLGLGFMHTISLAICRSM